MDPILTVPPSRLAADLSPHWFKSNLFLTPNFDSESYISELRTFVPLVTLRSELQAYFSPLIDELIDLINRDHADFVNLSINLVDVDAVIVRLRAPLLELREKIEWYKGSVEGSLVALQNGLRQRLDAAYARNVLELLLDTFHVLSKVEKLIKELPSVPADSSDIDVNLEDRKLMSNATSLQLTFENRSNVRETQSILLERIASEMNRLKFCIAHAQNLPFLENMDKRIRSACLPLDASLGHCFVHGLKQRDANVIYICLRAYVSIDNTRNAEAIFRTAVVAPLIQNIFLHGYSKAVAGASGDELETDYKQIKQCIENDCKLLLDISSAENSGLHVFDFLSNSILKEVLSAIQKGKPGAFSPGRPTGFLKNYKSSLDFLVHLEGYCPSRSAVAKFRAEPTYAEFMKQWNVGAYFSLRFQEIAGVLDSALAATSLAPIKKSNSNHGSARVFTLNQSASLLDSLKSCWREDVFLLSCSDKFLRLSLQLLSRYTNWLSSGLAARRSGNAGSNPENEWAISATPDDFIYIIHDINFLATEVSGDYLTHVLKLLSSCSSEVLVIVKQSILDSGKSLSTLLPVAINVIVDELVVEAVKDLKQLENITTYWMNNKPHAVGHSPYVSGILHPLKTLLEGERAMTYLTLEAKDELLHRAATEITNRYHKLTADFISRERKYETARLNIRKGAQKRAGASLDVSDHNIYNTGKICMQLFLDVQEYGKNLAALGVQVADISAYSSLCQCVACPDQQSMIEFEVN